MSWDMEILEDTSGSGGAVEILRRKIDEAKLRNSQMTLRAFALRIGLSSGALSEILKSKRPMSNSVKRRIAPKLMLSPRETLEFFKSDLPSELGNTSDDRMILSQDQFHLVSDWWYFGLLNLIKTRGFKKQTSWMASRLGLTTLTVAEAWERLLRLGYIEERGHQVVRKQPNLKTTDHVIDYSVRKSHVEDLKLIEKSLFEVPIDLRDHTSCTFVIDRKDIPKAKEMIRIFQQQFLNKFGKETGDEVYKMTIAAYPLTQVTKPDGE